MVRIFWFKSVAASVILLFKPADDIVIGRFEADSGTPSQLIDLKSKSKSKSNNMAL